MKDASLFNDAVSGSYYTASIDRAIYEWEGMWKEAVET